MRKNILRISLISLVFLFGCERSLSEEEVVSGVSENESAVENYRALIDLSISVTNQESGDVIQESMSKSDIVINEQTLDTYGTINESAAGESLTQEYYSVDDKAYLNLNDQGWMDMSNQQEALFQSTGTTYPNLVPIVEVISNIGELTENEDEYVYTFQGINADLYSSFESPYSLNFGSLSPEEVEQKVMVSIDKETLLIQDVTNELSGVQDGHDLVMTIHHTYKNMNEMNDISIPQEIIDSASSAQ